VKLLLSALLVAAPIFTSEPLSGPLRDKVRQTTWHDGCPIPPDELRVLHLSYWDYAGKQQEGILIVNTELAPELIAIFRELLRQHFPIERMEPVENFSGNDERSMDANNTSAFNCRDITGRRGKFSNHSWGRAIDINPLTNPYVKGNRVLPEAGRNYLDRTVAHTGSILASSPIVKLFELHGWAWGGNWPDRKDYQHFEKEP